ncbi:MAG: phenylalanine--tRNA ligase subunit beta, partial [Bacteroidota bacterium]
MNISHSWLTEYVQPGLAPAELADVLTMLGLEVDEVVQMGPALDGVVVGHVLDARQHPNADRLRVCVVDLGAEHNVEGEPVQIVCGAPNVAAGQYVPVATVGTTLMLPSRENPAEHVPVKIKKSKLRGEVSRGMICAEDELGLSEDHAGIMVLDGEPAPGTAFTDYLAAHNASSNDSIYDIALTPNRPDATSHFGVARDVAAVLDVELSKPAVELPTVGGAAAERISVQIEDPAGCPRYTAMVIDGVTIGPSPQWLQDRLTAIGLRPINNVVDVTNFVMHEIGQPLHAFDAAELSGNTIIIRAAEADEPFTTLDEKERTLPAGTVLICDAERPVAVGGVMGGLNSEVTDSTKTVVLESAYFDPSRIRKASKALALQTDASYRFERGVDPNGAAWAAARAAALIAEVAGGTVVDGIVDVYPEPIEPLTLTLRPARIKRIFGVDVPADEAAAYLNRLGIDTDTEDTDTEDTDTEDTETEAGGVLTCRVPTFRPDIEREIDLIEEVARMYGYDNLPRPAGLYVPYQPPQRDPVESLRSEVLTTLAGLGFRETYSNSLLPKSTAEQFANGESVVETLNPISQDMAAMRPSLLPGLLQAAGHNANHGQSAVRFAELGHVFRKAKPGEDTLVQGYHETEHLIIGMAGHAVSSSWNGDA